MKIRCLANTGFALPENYLKPEFCYTPKIDFPLTIGQEYIVYALKEWQGNIWYYISDDNYTYYPMQHPAPLFEVIDDRLSSYWRFKCYPNGLIRLAFKEWLIDPFYYDKLIDNFRTGIKKLISFPDQHRIYAIDKFWFALQKQDSWYLIIPLTVTQREDYSDIEKRPTNYSHVMLDLDKKAFLKAQAKAAIKEKSTPKLELFNLH
jgi:hypothetical protein